MKLSFNVNALLVALLFLAAGLAGCAPTQPPTPTLDLSQAAAAQATAIVQQAQATALIRQAQAQAAGLLDQTATVTPSPVQNTPAAAASPQPGDAPSETALSPTLAPTTSEEGQVQEVEILKVGYASDGVMIIVQFMAPPDVARLWMQGGIYVMDETTGLVYNEIPVMPVIGPLFARPKQNGQLGYVMFTNTPPGLPSGSLVTVVLGDFKQEHMVIQ